MLIFSKPLAVQFFFDKDAENVDGLSARVGEAELHGFGITLPWKHVNRDNATRVRGSKVRCDAPHQNANENSNANEDEKPAWTLHL